MVVVLWSVSFLMLRKRGQRCIAPSAGPRLSSLAVVVVVAAIVARRGRATSGCRSRRVKCCSGEFAENVGRAGGQAVKQGAGGRKVSNETRARSDADGRKSNSGRVRLTEGRDEGGYMPSCGRNASLTRVDTGEFGSMLTLQPIDRSTDPQFRFLVRRLQEEPHARPPHGTARRVLTHAHRTHAHGERPSLFGAPPPPRRRARRVTSGLVRPPSIGKAGCVACAMQ